MTYKLEKVGESFRIESRILFRHCIESQSDIKKDGDG